MKIRSIVNDNSEEVGTPLHKAAMNGHLAEAESLIARGAAINAKNDQGYTPLHLAAAFVQKDMVELLIAKGADVNAKGKDGWTPLAWAEASSNPDRDMEAVLRKHGARE
ncbi:MAG: ankyrin repeat domain-containing protein [bacterium]|nr:ankyrin repeat domain-containing protein [bacterium]